MTPLERIEKIENKLTALLQCPGDITKIEAILKAVRELKDQERLLAEIF